MSVFFAFINRLKYINRWSLMRRTRDENVMEHSAIVAMFAHTLAVLHTEFTGEAINAERVGMIALYHEAGEVITGDMPTPIKYFNKDITQAYKEIERQSEDKLTNTLPPELDGKISALFCGSDTENMLVKYADKLAAYVKCVEELAQGNKEFAEAEKSTKKLLKEYNSRAVDYFMDNFVTDFGYSLDKLSERLK